MQGLLRSPPLSQLFSTNVLSPHMPSCQGAHILSSGKPFPLEVMYFSPLRVRTSETLKLSVGSGVEDMVSNHVRPMRTVDYTDRLAEGPTGSRSLSK